jgi:hypothetical protein
MSSVWLTLASDPKNPQKLAGRLGQREATRYMRGRTIEYVKAGAGAGLAHEVKLCGDTVLLFCNGKLDGSLHVEHLSPPTLPGKGDNWVSKATQ